MSILKYTGYFYYTGNLLSGKRGCKYEQREIKIESGKHAVYKVQGVEKFDKCIFIDVELAELMRSNYVGCLIYTTIIRRYLDPSVLLHS